MNLIVTQPPESDELPWDKLKRQAQRIGHYIEQNGDLISKVTAEVSTQPLAVKLAKASGVSADVVSIMAQPGRSAKDIIVEHGTDRDNHVHVICVSNEQFEREFLPLFNLDEHEFQELVLMQSQCCCLMVIKSSSVAQLPLKVVTIIPSSALPKTFDVETAEGVETRKRPAYYYRQSGVIPWRMHNDELQVCLITSSKNNHWGFPKGIVEPGLTAEDSAANEALEEAGVKGDVGLAIGQFTYVKWGAVCKVVIFALRVSQVLPRSKWIEKHRNRHWCSLSLARHLVANPGYVDLINKLEVAHRANQLTGLGED